jgi:hypothetical protein
MSGQLNAPANLPPGNSLRYLLERRLSGPQKQSERPGEEKILDPTGTRTPTPLVVQRVASRYTDLVKRKFLIVPGLEFQSLLSFSPVASRYTD